MVLKRQPTIKTLLVVTALNAVLLSSNLPSQDNPARYLVLNALISQAVFWTISLLSLSVFIRSTKRVAMACFGLGCALMAITYLYLLITNEMFQQGLIGTKLQWEIQSIVQGPFSCLQHPLTLWMKLTGDESFIPSEGVYSAFQIAWLGVYSATGIMVAKSCRLKEQVGMTRGDATR